MQIYSINKLVPPHWYFGAHKITCGHSNFYMFWRHDGSGDLDIAPAVATTPYKQSNLIGFWEELSLKSSSRFGIVGNKVVSLRWDYFHVIPARSAVGKCVFITVFPPSFHLASNSYKTVETHTQRSYCRASRCLDFRKNELGTCCETKEGKPRAYLILDCVKWTTSWALLTSCKQYSTDVLSTRTLYFCYHVHVNK